jgi:hypothetical protein
LSLVLIFLVFLVVQGRLDEFEKICGNQNKFHRALYTEVIDTSSQEQILLFKSAIQKLPIDYEFRKFWYENKFKFSRLVEVVKKYSIIPASSVASESAFSEANYIQRKERASLSSKNLALYNVSQKL